MSLKFVSSISITRCQALFGQSALHRSTVNFQVLRMCSVKLHSTQFNTCYHSNDNVSVIIVCNNWTFAHCFFSSFFSFLLYIYLCLFFSHIFLSTTSWWIKIYIYYRFSHFLHLWFCFLLYNLLMPTFIEEAIDWLIDHPSSSAAAVWSRLTIASSGVLRILEKRGQTPQLF